MSAEAEIPGPKLQDGDSPLKYIFSPCVCIGWSEFLASIIRFGFNMSCQCAMIPEIKSQTQIQGFMKIYFKR